MLVTRADFSRTLLICGGRVGKPKIVQPKGLPLSKKSGSRCVYCHILMAEILIVNRLWLLNAKRKRNEPQIPVIVEAVVVAVAAAAVVWVLAVAMHAISLEADKTCHHRITNEILLVWMISGDSETKRAPDSPAPKERLLLVQLQCSMLEDQTHAGL